MRTVIRNSRYTKLSYHQPLLILTILTRVHQINILIQLLLLQILVTLLFLLLHIRTNISCNSLITLNLHNLPNDNSSFQILIYWNNVISLILACNLFFVLFVILFSFEEVLACVTIIFIILDIEYLIKTIHDITISIWLFCMISVSIFFEYL